MKTYNFALAGKLVFSVDFAPWETVVFQQDDFHDPAQATAEELAVLLNHSGSLACTVAADGTLVLASASHGDISSLEIDLPNSTAAAPLGLGSTNTLAHGAGLSPARLVGQTTQPFTFSDGSAMTIEVDGAEAYVEFAGLPPTAGWDICPLP